MTFKHINFFIYTCIIVVCTTFSSCKDENDDLFVAEPTLIIEGATDGVYTLKLAAKGVAHKTTAGGGFTLGSAKKIAIRSNARWRLVPKDGSAIEDWYMILPMEGEKDMYVRVACYPNETKAQRSAEFTLEVQGKDSGQSIVLIQPAK